MRVTGKMINMTILNNLNTGYNRMGKMQDQMSSGQIVSRPSDDPVITTRMVTLYSVLKQHDQHKRNMDDALTWMDTTEKTLGSVNNVFQRVRELMVQGINGTLTNEDRDKIVQEVDQLNQNLGQLANTTHANRYIFAGTNTTVKPFSEITPGAGDFAYSGNNGQLNWEVSPDVTIAVNLDGDEVFDPAAVTPVVADGSSSIFNLMNNVRTYLHNGDTTNLSSCLVQLDNAIEANLNLRSEMGAKVNRLEMAVERSIDENLNYQALQSKLNDVDMSKLYIDFTTQQTVLQSALAAGAKIMQTNLIDFLQ